MPLIETLCPECEAHLGQWLAENAAAAGRLDWRCGHRAVAVSLRVSGGEVTGWTAWSCPDEDAFRRALALRAGGEAGLRAHLDAEATLARAAGGDAH